MNKKNIQKLSKIDKIKIWVSVIFQLLLIAIIIFSIFKSEWLNLLISVITLVLILLPSIIEKRYKIDFPSEMEILVLCFIFAATILGEVTSFYDKFAWWDIMLHSLSGVILGGIGFSLVYILNRELKSKFDISPLFVAIFAASFAITLGVFWEIFEFVMDYSFGLNMQTTGLVDTMWDLILDSIGAIIISILGALMIKYDLDFLKKIDNKLLLKDGHKPT